MFIIEYILIMVKKVSSLKNVLANITQEDILKLTKLNNITDGSIKLLYKCKEEKCTKEYKILKKKSEDFLSNVRKELVKFGDNKCTNEELIDNIKNELYELYKTYKDNTKYISCVFKNCKIEYDNYIINVVNYYKLYAEYTTKFIEFDNVKKQMIKYIKIYDIEKETDALYDIYINNMVAKNMTEDISPKIMGLIMDIIKKLYSKNKAFLLIMTKNGQVNIKSFLPIFDAKVKEFKKKFYEHYEEVKL